MRGIEVGNIFKLGTRYSDSMGCTFLDKEGQTKPIIMGSYGIGSGRLLASVAEEYNDDQGLILPISVAPFQASLIALTGVEEIAEKAYATLVDHGFEVLYDDREESPGVKFADADLIGLPIRLTVSSRSVEGGGVELKLRSEPAGEIVPSAHLVDTLQETIQKLQDEIAARVVDMPYEE